MMKFFFFSVIVHAVFMLVMLSISSSAIPQNDFGNLQGSWEYLGFPADDENASMEIPDATNNATMTSAGYTSERSDPFIRKDFYDGQGASHSVSTIPRPSAYEDHEDLTLPSNGDSFIGSSEQFSTPPSTRPRGPQVDPHHGTSRTGHTDGFLLPLKPPSSSSTWISDQTAAIRHDIERRKYAGIPSYPMTFPRFDPSPRIQPRLPIYHAQNPTKMVVEFAELRKDIATKVKAVQARTNAIDQRITDLLNGNLTEIRKEMQQNSELIKTESDRRTAGLKRASRISQEQIRTLREDVQNIHDNLESMRQLVNANKASQEAALQTIVGATKSEIRQLSDELSRIFKMIQDLQKQRFID